MQAPPKEESDSIDGNDLSDIQWNLKEFQQSLDNIKTKISSPK